MPKRWPIRLQPQPGELFSSWISRQASAYSHDLSGLLTDYPFQSLPKRIDIDRAWPYSVADYLAENIGVERDIAQSTMLHDWSLNPSTFTSDSASHWFYSNGREGVIGIQYCPLCLSSDVQPYFRKQWRMTWATVCPIHECSLETKCHSCNDVAYYSAGANGLQRQHIAQCRSCGADLRNAPTVQPTNFSVAIKTQDDWLGFCKSRIVKSGGVTWDLSSAMQFIQRMASQLLTRTTGGIAARQIIQDRFGLTLTGTPLSTFVNSSTEYRADLYRLLTHLMSDWPLNYRSVLIASKVSDAFIIRKLNGFPKPASRNLGQSSAHDSPFKKSLTQSPDVTHSKNNE